MCIMFTGGKERHEMGREKTYKKAKNRTITRELWKKIKRTGMIRMCKVLKGCEFVLKKKKRKKVKAMKRCTARRSKMTMGRRRRLLRKSQN